MMWGMFTLLGPSTIGWLASIRSQRQPYTWGASTWSSTTGSQDNQGVSTSFTFTFAPLYLHILVTADTQFSVALMLALVRPSLCAMTAERVGIISAQTFA